MAKSKPDACDEKTLEAKASRQIFLIKILLSQPRRDWGKGQREEGKGL